MRRRFVKLPTTFTATTTTTTATPNTKTINNFHFFSSQIQFNETIEQFFSPLLLFITKQ